MIIGFFLLFFRYGYACVPTPPGPINACDDYLVPFSNANTPNNVPDFLDQLNAANPFVYSVFSTYFTESQTMTPEVRALYFKRVLASAQNSMDAADYNEILNLKVPKWGNKSVQELLQCIPTENVCDRTDVLVNSPDLVGTSLWMNCDPFAFGCTVDMSDAMLDASVDGVFLQNTYTYSELRQYLQTVANDPRVDMTLYRQIVIFGWGGTVGDILDNAC
uniref:Secreted protein n=1 Tax=Syphacia muris TaxID=451379 RepID=A0A0N5AC36_9BILA